MKSLLSSKQIQLQLSRRFFFVFFLGLLVRLFVCLNTFIINPDGALYIHQARAMYYGEWEKLTTCGMSYLSIYPFFIAGAYTIFHNWIVAAKSVSFFFGSITLIPVYLILRRFFDDKISALSTLVFSLIPVFVVGSADIIKGPIYWFFLTTGLYLFISQINKNRYRLSLLLCCLSFLIAASARIESVLFIIVSCLFLMAVKQEKRIEKSVIFVLPVVLILIIVFFSSLFIGVPVKDIFRINEVADKLSMSIIEYKHLRAVLAELVNHPPVGVSRYFFEIVRNLVWLIALGTVFIYIVKVFFYPFFLIFIAGIGDIRSKMREDHRLRYLVLLSMSSIILLYFHVLQTWFISRRFLVPFVLPSLVFLGFGLENIVSFLRSKFKLNARTALVIVCLFILSFGLAKNLKPREVDKLVFKEIGEFIAEQEGINHVIPVAASLYTIRWISFYSNLNYPGSPCPQPYNHFTEIIGKNYKQFVNNLKIRGMKYFLWEEKHWPRDRFDFIKELKPEDFKKIGRWEHPDTGELILFKIK